MSRATITVSATAGRPGMPSRLDHAPSCMCPPPASDSSSACCATTAPGSDAAYSSARRITPALGDARAVVGEDPHAERVQLAHRRELLARAPHA